MQLDRNKFLDELQSRQELIFGKEASIKLRESVVGIAGFGGVGALALELLARAGVGRFNLLDKDNYEISNMNRQVFATLDSLGRPKVEVAAERIKLINPFAEIGYVFNEIATMHNIEKLLDDADIGVVCTDFPSSHIFFHQVARQKRLRLVIGYAAKFNCGIYTADYGISRSKFHPFNIPLIQKIYNLIKGQKDNCEEEQYAFSLDTPFRTRIVPSVGYAANITACLLANATIRYLTNTGRNPNSIYLDFERIKMKS